MSYYTNYTGEVMSGADEKDIAKAIAALDFFNCADDPNIETIDEVINYDTITWRSWKTDMIEISKRFPNALIRINGEGEDSYDIWRAYFQNGKCAVYQAKIIFPEFNKDDLRDGNFIP